MDFYMLWLSKVFKHSNSIFNFLNNENIEKIFNMPVSEIFELSYSEELKTRLSSFKLKDDAKRDYEYCAKNNIKILDFSSNDYPINLRHIPLPPPLLYYKGTIKPQDECSISIVGSRKYSEYGQLVTKKFSSELASVNITIISGMARGIDAFAHSYAIGNNGRTLAVLGSGIDIIYPEENKRLYDEIINNGAVLSQFPLHTQPIPEHFPIRNQIVAGLSLGTLVIEANEKSGTMITARYAGDFGRNVYAVPGGIFNSTSRGTNSLIKDGAKIVTCTEDILQDIFTEIGQLIPKPKQLSLFIPSNLSDSEQKIYNLLSLEPTYIDSLAEKVSIPLPEIIQILTLLQLNGYIKELPGQKYTVIN